jgi:hypothetical protein
MTSAIFVHLNERLLSQGPMLQNFFLFNKSFSVKHYQPSAISEPMFTEDTVTILTGLCL